MIIKNWGWLKAFLPRNEATEVPGPCFDSWGYLSHPLLRNLPKQTLTAPHHTPQRERRGHYYTPQNPAPHIKHHQTEVYSQRTEELGILLKKKTTAPTKSPPRMLSAGQESSRRTNQPQHSPNQQQLRLFIFSGLVVGKPAGIPECSRIIQEPPTTHRISKPLLFSALAGQPLPAMAFQHRSIQAPPRHSERK